MQETQESISEWAEVTFGNVKANNIVARLNLEMAELVDHNAKEEYIKCCDECADLLIVLYQVATCFNIDLLDEVNRKMQINRSRKWHLHGDGTGQHID